MATAERKRQRVIQADGCAKKRKSPEQSRGVVSYDFYLIELVMALSRKESMTIQNGHKC
jgi:hypothetical protein